MPAALFHNDKAFWTQEAQCPKPMPALFIEIGVLVPCARGHTFKRLDGLPEQFMQPAVVARITFYCDQHQCVRLANVLEAANLTPNVFIETVTDDFRGFPKQAVSHDFSGVIFIAGDVPNALRAVQAHPDCFSFVDTVNMRIALETADANFVRDMKTLSVVSTIEVHP